MDWSPPGSSVQRIPRQEYWSGPLFPSPGDLPDPGIESASPALTGKFFTTVSPGKPSRWVSVQFSSVQLLSRVRLFVTPWAVACQASLSVTNSQSLLRLMSALPSNHLILCRPLLLLPSIFPSIRVFSDESVLHIKWPKCWSFSFSISPSREEKDRITMTFQCY